MAETRDETAKRLGLTKMRRAFCEYLAEHPDEGPARAAQAVGDSTAKAAAVTAVRWMKREDVREYLSILTREATQLAERKTRRRIMRGGEVLARLSAQARADIGQHLAIGEDGVPRVHIDRRYTHTLREVVVRDGGKADAPWSETRIRVSDPRPALEALARVYGLDQLKPPQDGPRVNVQVFLANLPTDALRAIQQALVLGQRGAVQRVLGNGNGNGNGNQAS